MFSKENIVLLQNELKKNHLKAYLVLTSDPHDNEYISKFYLREREFFCPFTGSAGSLLITDNNAYFSTDGRYWIQAEKELKGSGISLIKDGDVGVLSLNDFIKKELLYPLGVNYLNISKSKLDLLNKLGITTVDIDFSKLIKSNSESEIHKVFKLSDELNTLTYKEKIDLILNEVEKKGADAHLITTLDDIAYVLNLRGKDIPCNPVFYSYLYLSKTSGNHLFIDQRKIDFKIPNIEIHSYDEIDEFLRKHCYVKTLVDPKRVNAHLYSILHEPIVSKNPSYLMKAIKGEKEIENTRKIQAIDGLALLKFQKYLEDNLSKNLTEYDYSMKLEEFRKESELCFDLSFETIAAVGSNAAMMHYEPTKETHSKVTKNEIELLVDSGGQYYGGTTDTTRTFLIGKPTKEFIHDYTLTLKSLIAVSKAIFLEKSDGHTLDILARQFMWNEGMDYKWIYFLSQELKTDYWGQVTSSIAPYPGDNYKDKVVGTDPKYLINPYDLCASLGTLTRMIVDGDSYQDIMDKADELHIYHLQQNNSGDYIACFTAFIDEYYYQKNPLTNEFVGWDAYTRQPDRTMLIASNIEISDDGNSSYTTARTAFIQRSIQTYYNGDIADETNAMGVETYCENYRIGTTTYDGYGANSSSNGRENMKDLIGFYYDDAWQWNSSVNIAANGYWKSNTSAYLDHKIDNILVDESPYYACLSRNRDLDGDGDISDDEIRWYLPASDQYLRMNIGADAMSEASRLFLGNRAQLPSNYPHGNNNSLYEAGSIYYTSTYNSGIDYESGIKQVLWAAEVGALGNMSAGHSYGLVRCIRNLPSKEVVTRNSNEIVVDDRALGDVSYTLKRRGAGNNALYVFDFENRLDANHFNNLSKRNEVHIIESPTKSGSIYYAKTWLDNVSPKSDEKTVIVSANIDILPLLIHSLIYKPSKYVFNVKFPVNITATCAHIMRFIDKKAEDYNERIIENPCSAFILDIYNEIN